MSNQRVVGGVQFSPRGFPNKNDFGAGNQPIVLRPEMGKTSDMFSFKKTQMIHNSISKGGNMANVGPVSQKALMFKTFNTEKSLMGMSNKDTVRNTDGSNTRFESQRNSLPARKDFNTINMSSTKINEVMNSVQAK